MFHALGRFTFRHRRLLVGLWLAILVVSIPFSSRVGSVLEAGGFTNPRSEGSQGVRLLHDEMGAHLSSITIVFNSADYLVRDAAYQAEMQRVLAPLYDAPGVGNVVGLASTGNARFVSSDGRSTYVLVGLDMPVPEAQRLVPQLKAMLPESWLEVYVTGGPAAYADLEVVSHEDLQRAELISLPLALLALIVVFRSPLAAAVPVLVGGTSVSLTLALIFGLAHVTDLSIFVQNIATMLGLGISIDYALFLVSRFREERAHHDVEEALSRSLATAGRAVMVSGLTVCVGLLGLLLYDYMLLRSIGVGGALIAVVAVVANLTFLPALLAMADQRIAPAAQASAATGGRWHALAVAVSRRPGLVVAVLLPLLLGLGVPFLRVHLGAPDVTVLPQRVESRQGFDLLRSKFGAGEVAPIVITVEAPGSIMDREAISELYDYTRRLEALPGVVRVESIVNIAPEIAKAQYQLLYSRPGSIQDPSMQQAIALLSGGRVAAVTAVTEYAPASVEARTLVEQVRAVPLEGGLQRYVGGAAAELRDVVADLYGTFPRVLLFVLIVTGIALYLQFRSVLLPVKALFMDTLSILASYGALVLIFQDGHLSWLLRFTPEGFVDATTPIVMFCVLFGLSMDYEVFMLSRIQERYLQTGDNAGAVAQGLEETGHIITSAALIIVLVSGSFALADVVVIKALGVGVAIAIFLDATIVRALLVPATMCLLGRWNWWRPGAASPDHRPPMRNA